ncbi:MAG: glycoside hydrolase family 27 protein [Promicromonosporaceae bacterium]|nr:glycoside hydrolase family 27 protein [Promicromonosporaceae bacterium]
MARPPMGWNSWDCYGTSVTEAEVLANARFMAEHLLPFGWDTVVVDIDWSDPTARAHGYNAGAPLAMDAHGRLVPDEGRFPSSRGGAGFGPLAAQVHALGLRFGIHTMRGIPRLAVEQASPVLGTQATAADVVDRTNVCEWNPDMFGLDHAHPAAQAYYDSTLALYAGWGVDFIKSDDMLWPYQVADIEAYARAIERTGRPIELSLSPGRDLSLTRLEHLREHATMWRICDDLWDRWEDVEANFARFARWAPHAGDAGWPDGDMLPLGRVGLRAERGEPRDDRLTPAERRTLMTLWAVARSPLMIGGDLPTTDPATIALFTNPDVLAVHAHGRGAREVFREDPLVLWTAEGPAGERYAAAFNLGAEPLAVTLDVANVGLPAAPSGGVVRELWTGADLPVMPVGTQSDDARGVAPGSAAVRLTLEPHGCALLRG